MIYDYYPCDFYPITRSIRPWDVDWSKVSSRPQRSSYRYWESRPQPKARELVRLERRRIANERAAAMNPAWRASA